jgi:GH15 family glucan-1,4-alpha-glucosidase
MALKIEDYAVIGDTHTAALVGRDGSIDWLCVPRFDSPAVFAKILGDSRHGYWRIAPVESGAPDSHEPLMATRRSYRKDSLVLETVWQLPSGTVQVTDCMPVREDRPEVVRVVEGLSGRVDMRLDLVMRFGYGRVVPWVRRVDGLLTAIAGPDGLALWSPVYTRGEDLSTVANFTVSEGQRVPFVLAWYPSHLSPPRPVDGHYGVEDTHRWWTDWVALSSVGDDCAWRDALIRSEITLKALNYAPTGGIVAAVTTSLPETLGGERNWDYRYCWLRDATLTLTALMAGGYHDEAIAWRDWLLRAVAGDPGELQIMYGPAGERDLLEMELDFLPGYERSCPVRVGNAAAGQFQLDVYGEVLAALHESRRSGMDVSEEAWHLETLLLDFLESGWKEPDDGIWEVRGPRRPFTHSKVMAWVAMDRAVRDVEEFNLEGPVERWKAIREEIHQEVCEKGYDPHRNTFTQYYGSRTLDASTLLIPTFGFLPPSDPRVVGTVEAIQRELTHDGFVLRYDAENAGDVDGLSGREGAFLACSFWLVDDLELIGRHGEALALFEKLLALRNDVGLLSEEYDTVAKRLVGNFPQAFSHISLVNSAVNLSRSQQGPDIAPGLSHAERLAGKKLPPLRHFTPAHISRHRKAIGVRRRHH